MSNAGPCHVQIGPYISHPTETTQRTSFDVRSFHFPDHQTLARQTSRPPSALFAADAKRRQGFEQAGRDRFALRSASRRLWQGRPEDAGVPVAEPKRQDPGDPRSRRTRWKAASPVRVRRDPAISRREDRKAAAGGWRAALADYSMGPLPDGRD